MTAVEFREVDEQPSAEEQTEHAWWVAFGASMRAARKARGLRQDDLAAILGLSRTSVANIEGGRQHATAYTAARLVAELGMTVPGWTVDPAMALLARQLTQARHALVTTRDHLAFAVKSAETGLADQYSAPP